jgi:hypothetical protein
MKTTSVLSFIASITILSIGQARSAGTVISVDFNSSPVSTFSGIESMAAAANPAFNEASTWNPLPLTYSPDGTGADVDPSFSDLVDSTGASTTVGLEFTGTVPSYYNAYGNQIWSDFIWLNADVGGNHDTIDWILTGLPANTLVDIYFYNVHTHDYRSFDMHYDGDGDGTLESVTVVDWQNDGYVPGIQTSASGEVAGSMQIGTGTSQASWAGFQINIVPEPGPFVLLALGVVAVAGRRRRAGHRGMRGGPPGGRTHLGVATLCDAAASGNVASGADTEGCAGGRRGG